MGRDQHRRAAQDRPSQAEDTGRERGAEAPAARAPARAAVADVSGRLEPHDLLALQRSLGNRAVQRILAQGRARRRPAPDPAPPIQRLTILTPGGLLVSYSYVMLPQGVMMCRTADIPRGWQPFPLGNGEWIFYPPAAAPAPPAAPQAAPPAPPNPLPAQAGQPAPPAGGAGGVSGAGLVVTSVAPSGAASGAGGPASTAAASAVQAPAASAALAAGAAASAVSGGSAPTVGVHTSATAAGTQQGSSSSSSSASSSSASSAASGSAWARGAHSSPGSAAAAASAAQPSATTASAAAGGAKASVGPAGAAASAAPAAPPRILTVQDVMDTGIYVPQDDNHDHTWIGTALAYTFNMRTCTSLTLFHPASGLSYLRHADSNTDPKQVTQGVNNFLQQVLKLSGGHLDLSRDLQVRIFAPRANKNVPGESLYNVAQGLAAVGVNQNVVDLFKRADIIPTTEDYEHVVVGDSKGAHVINPGHPLSTLEHALGQICAGAAEDASTKYGDSLLTLVDASAQARDPHLMMDTLGPLIRQALQVAVQRGRRKLAAILTQIVKAGEAAPKEIPADQIRAEASRCLDLEIKRRGIKPLEFVKIQLLFEALVEQVTREFDEQSGKSAAAGSGVARAAASSSAASAAANSSAASGPAAGGPAASGAASNSAAASSSAASAAANSPAASSPAASAAAHSAAASSPAASAAANSSAASSPAAGGPAASGAAAKDPNSPAG